MSTKVNFVFALHCHQPVGNFDKVVESAFRDAYEPFLDVLENHPRVRLSLHLSGCLFEWIETHHPDYLKRLQRLVSAGGMEMIGGGFFEPIFPMLPERDRIGQIRAFSQYLKTRFKAVPTGMWLPERVWEQALVKSFVDAGMKYTVLDDFHFKCAGLRGHELGGYYTTEDEGRVFNVFPISEELRYAIPFKEPEHTLDVLKRFARPDGTGLVVYADDGEKFGVWPRTKKHVYEHRWLERFMSAIEANLDWINLLTFSEALEKIKPIGRTYLPDCSYREMTEWALPAAAQEEHARIIDELRGEGRLDRYAPFFRGGTWRNFRSKYRESNLMCAKMWHVSDQIAKLPASAKGTARARLELYRGQCNCAYWHGVFGGLYLPHLRDAVYRKLISAQAIADEAASGRRQAVRLERHDFDMDGHEEVFASNGVFTSYFAPARGGHLYELGVVGKQFNVMNTLTRRREAYHSKVSMAKVIDDIEQVETIHNMVLAKQPGLEAALHYDRYERESLVDHFFAPDATLQQFTESNYAEEGDFIGSQYSLAAAKERKGITLAFVRRGELLRDGTRWPVEIRRTVKLASSTATMQIRYSVLNLATQDISCRFGPEFNFSMLACDKDDRYCYWDDSVPAPTSGSTPLRGVKNHGQDAHATGGRHKGFLNTQSELANVSLFGIVDMWQRFDISLQLRPSAGLWTFPVRTVSQSEAGFELVYQSSAVVPVWPLFLRPGEMATMEIDLAAGET